MDTIFLRRWVSGDVQLESVRLIVGLRPAVAARRVDRYAAALKHGISGDAARIRSN